MKHPPITKQSHQHTRSFPLSDLRAQLDEQRLNVGPANIRRHWPVEYLLKGVLVLSPHVRMVSNYGITNQAISFLTARHAAYICRIEQSLVRRKSPAEIPRHGLNPASAHEAATRLRVSGHRRPVETDLWLPLAMSIHIYFSGGPVGLSRLPATTTHKVPPDDQNHAWHASRHCCARWGCSAANDWRIATYAIKGSDDANCSTDFHAARSIFARRRKEPEPIHVLRPCPSPPT